MECASDVVAGRCENDHDRTLIVPVWKTAPQNFSSAIGSLVSTHGKPDVVMIPAGYATTSGLSHEQHAGPLEEEYCKVHCCYSAPYMYLECFCNCYVTQFYNFHYTHKHTSTHKHTQTTSHSDFLNHKRYLEM